MLPTWRTTVTVYHKIIDKINKAVRWERAAYHNCFYKKQKTEAITGDTLTQISSYIVRIPTNTELPIANGDIVAKGIITEDIPDNDSGNTFIKNHKDNCFVVKYCSANIGDGLLLQHYHLGGV